MPSELLTSADSVAVIGAGTMGAGIAQVAAAAGHPVLLFDSVNGRAAAACRQIAASLDERVAGGKLSEVESQAQVDRITPVAALDALAPARLAIEAIVEDLEVKQLLFQRLESICAEDCLFASNTSSISITAIAASLTRPQRFAGMHFFNPAPIMKLVEVVSGLATDPLVAQNLQRIATAWGKQAVHARSTPGFIVNRVARPFYAEALRLLQEGATDAATLDAVLREAGGFRMGPFELMDLIGHDVNFAVTRSVFDASFSDPRFTPSQIQQELVLAGRLGRKSGRGFFDYADGAGPPLVANLPAGRKPSRIRVFGTADMIAPLVDAWRDNGIEIDRVEAESAPMQGMIEVGDILLAQTDGRSATQRCADDALAGLVLYDLALDYTQAGRIAIAVAAQADAAAASIAAGLLQAAGKVVSQLADIPGLAVMRTVAMLANEAADAVNQGVCSITDVDTAMCSGVNYPLGPLAWADRIGVERLRLVLRNLADVYGEDRYRCSPLISQRVAARENFHYDGPRQPPGGV